MTRETQTEILERDGLPDHLVFQAYRDLAAIHHWLGDIRFVTRAIGRDPRPVRRILDIGSGPGLVLEQVGRRLRVPVIGIDLRVSPNLPAPVPVIRANALYDRLPRADVAFSMCLGHHLREEEIVALIRNVGRFCRRFILIDLVRDRVPLFLFKAFVAPLISPINSLDGQLSIKRSYTPSELHRIASVALKDSGATFRLSVAPFKIRQVLDISYRTQPDMGAGQRV